MLVHRIRRGTELVFEDPEGTTRLCVTFYRTLRVPDDGNSYFLPAGMGPFPIRRVSDYADRVPPHWLARPGVVVPMHQREAIWIGLVREHAHANAVKIGAGMINAVSGKPWNRRLVRPERPSFIKRALGYRPTQDYLVSPPQEWLDGFNTGHGTVRQMVAMPLGAGVTVEGQLTGREQHGGLQILVYQPRPGLFPTQHAPLRPDATASEPEIGASASTLRFTPSGDPRAAVMPAPADPAAAMIETLPMPSGDSAAADPTAPAPADAFLPDARTLTMDSTPPPGGAPASRRASGFDSTLMGAGSGPARPGSSETSAKRGAPAPAPGRAKAAPASPAAGPASAPASPAPGPAPGGGRPPLPPEPFAAQRSPDVMAYGSAPPAPGPVAPGFAPPASYETPSAPMAQPQSPPSMMDGRSAVGPHRVARLGGGVVSAVGAVVGGVAAVAVGAARTVAWAGDKVIPATPDVVVPVQAMGLAAGGQINQKIYPDPYGIDTWDQNNLGEVFVYLVDSVNWRQITGENPPRSPICAATYREAGYVWVARWDQDDGDVAPGRPFEHIKSLGELDPQDH